MKLYQKIAAAVRSNKFFYGVVALLVVEASWIALSSHYPMAFDEDFHFGIIKLYAHHLSPWWSSQPAGGDIYGAVYRDPSYLYHWLMSFPYRLINVFTHNTTIQVIILRLLNVAMFAAGLVVLRQLLLKVTRSKALINLALLFLVLTPVIPSLAGQINYDNLLFLLVPLSLLLTVNFLQELRAQKQINLPVVVGLACLCLLSSLVKYAFLPVFAVIVFFLLFVLFQTYHKTGRQLGKELTAAYKKLSRWAVVGLVLVLAVSGVLFFERYGINTLRYDTPLPECNQVLLDSQCAAYGPWDRNYNILQSKGQPNSGTVSLNVATFSQHWGFVLYRSLFYILNGPDSGYAVGEPLLLPWLVALGVTVVGTVALIKYRKKIFNGNPARMLLAAVIVVYAAALWLQNYSDYRHLGQPVALQGRYLIPILAPLYLFLALGFAWMLRHHRQAGVFLAVVAVLLFLEGGGIVTFLVRSDNSWYITNSVSAEVNNKVQKVVKPVVIPKGNY